MRIRNALPAPASSGQGVRAPESTQMGAAEVGFAGKDGELPELLKAIIAKEDASRDELVRASQLAERSGYHKLAGALRERAEDASSDKSASLIESPWKDTPSLAWTRFCRIMSAGNTPDKISAKGFFGLFQLSVRRLCDLGVMRDPRCRNVHLPKGGVARIWEGTWVLPRDKFLADPRLQYSLFSRSMELYRSIIAEKYKQVIGLPIEGQPATLSGLLALAHSAGSGGMHKWLVEGDIRRKFTWVTDAYLRANGIF